MNLRAFVFSSCKKSYDTVIKYSSSFVLVILAMLFVSIAAATNDQEAYATRPWSNYQNNEAGDGSTNVFGTFLNISSITFQNVKSFGADFQPIAIDLDGDGINELVTSQSTIFRVSRIATNSHDLGVLDEYTTHRSQIVSASAAYLGGKDVIAYTDNKTMYMFSFNGTNIIVEDSYNLSILPTFYGVNALAGMKCSSNGAGDKCYFVSYRTTTTSFQVFTYDVDLNSFTSSTSYNSGFPPNAHISVYDWDNDGTIEVAVATGGIGTTGKIWVIDTNTGLAETNFNPKTLSSNHVVNHLVFDNIDGGGKAELIVSESTATTSFLSAYNTAGTQVWSNTVLNAGGGTICYTTTPIIGTFKSATYEDVCVQTDCSFTPVNRMKCYNKETGVQTWTRQNSQTESLRNNVYEPLIAVDIDNDGFKDIVGNKFMVSPRDNSTFNYTGYTTDGRLIIVDMNGDSSGEIVSQSASQTWTMFSSFTNAPPVIGTRTYGQSYSSPICTGTTLSFTASECGSQPCHYTNDNEFDTERLASNCGINATIQNGSFSGANPIMGCYYAHPGSYPSVYIYLQDAANKNDYTQYKVVSITVVNGTPGFSCNLPPTIETTTGSNVTAGGGTTDGTLSQSDINFIVNTMTGGGSSLVKAILMVAFTLGIIIYFARVGIHNPVIHAAGVFGVWTLCAIVGLINWIYVIIFAFVIIGAASVFWVKGNSQGQ